MTEEVQKKCQKIQEEVIREIDLQGKVEDEAIWECIEECVLKMGHTIYLSAKEKDEMIRTVFNSIRRWDVLQEILEDNSITEVMVNGPDHIFIERDGKISPYPHSFSSREKLEDIVQQIVAGANRRVNEADPIADVRLMDGSRVNIVLPPIALEGPVVTIRKFPSQPIGMEKLIEIGSVSKEAASFLQCLVRAKYNIFISGGTGSGKTTFLNALSDYIPPEERIITIEDAAELQICNIPNLVRLEVRNANLEGKHAITIRDLMKSALRMRPDRIILGEVRDAAACELLNVMNTGHDGSLCTGHANSPSDMLNRLETLVLTGMDIPLMAIRNQIASALDIVVQLGRLRDKSRKVLEIDEVMGIKDGEVLLVPLYRFEESGNEKAIVKGSLKPTGHTLAHREKLQAAGIELPEGL
ncbi:MAG: CpaF family protein [Butyribacter sp.]|nr:CpaF family protein [bacterium]MDY3854214.1 CpaF family protein [Butyribacter sp.]